jgi:hypothetical protein
MVHNAFDNMRLIIFFLVLVLIVGGIVAAALLVYPASLTPEQVAQTNTTCDRCHAAQILGENTNNIHTLHRGFECSACHESSSDVEEFEDNVRQSTCNSCHSQPAYTNVTTMHNAHSTTECSICHSESTGLTSVNRAHSAVKWIGISLAVAVAAGLILNFIVTKIRLGRKNR